MVSSNSVVHPQTPVCTYSVKIEIDQAGNKNNGKTSGFIDPNVAVPILTDEVSFTNIVGLSLRHRK